MELQPFIASYISQSAGAIRRILNASALEAVDRVAEGPVRPADLDPILRGEWIEMHVFRELDGLIWLDTSVLLERDIQRVSEFALTLPTASPYSVSSSLEEAGGDLCSSLDRS